MLVRCSATFNSMDCSFERRRIQFYIIARGELNFESIDELPSEPNSVCINRYMRGIHAMDANEGASVFTVHNTQPNPWIQTEQIAIKRTTLNISAHQMAASEQAENQHKRCHRTYRLYHCAYKHINNQLRRILFIRFSFHIIVFGCEFHQAEMHDERKKE